MTIHTPLDDESGGNALAATLYLLAQAREAVMGHLTRLEAEEGLGDQTFAPQIKNLRETLKLVVTESHNVAKLRREAGEDGAGTVFDLDAARAEIGLRLACLRDA